MFRQSADPTQLAILTKALDLYCERQVVSSPEEREDIAAMVMDLFTRGATSAEEIVAGLERMTKPARGARHPDQHAA